MALRYVAPSGGSDTGGAGGGAIGSPFATIAYGVQYTSAGDTLQIRGGTHTGSGATIDSQGHVVNSGTSYANAVTIMGYPGETAILQPPYDVSAVRLYTAVSYIVIKDLKFDGINTALPATPDAAIFSLTDHIHLDNCEAYDWPMFGFHSGNDAPFMWVTRCRVHDIGVPGDGLADGHGMYMTSPDSIYEDNEIYDCTGYGLHIYNNSGPHTAPARVIVRRNKIHDIGLHGPTAYAIVVAWGDDFEIYSNVIWNCPGGIQVYTSTTDVKIHHNTFDNIGPDGAVDMQFYGIGGLAITVQNVLISTTCTSSLNDYGGNGTVVDDHNHLHTDADPGFTNAGTFDFTISDTSPAYHTGVAVATVTSDYLGNAFNDPPSKGAYEVDVEGGGGGGWTLIAQTSAPCTNAVTEDESLTDEINTTNADLIVINVGWYSGVSTTLVITDAHGNAWTPGTIRTVSGVISDQQFYCDGPGLVTGPGHWFQAANGGAAGPIYVSCQVQAWSGSHATSAFGGETGATEPGGAATTISTGSVTPDDNSLIVAGLAHEENAAGAVSINLGFTADDVPYSSSVPAEEGSAVAYLVLPTSAAKNPQWNLTNAAYSAATITWFKGFATSGAGAPWAYYAQQ